MSDDFEVQHKPSGWYITRNIPVAIIGALAIQLLVAGWVASKYDSRIATQEEKIVTIKEQVAVNTVAQTTLQQRLASIEGKLEYIIQSVKEPKK